MNAPSHVGPPKPALYVVATPLGNLEDLSSRAAQILRSVPCVAAEDTRVTRTLLAHLGVRPEIFPAHAHNEEAATEQILLRLQAGQAVALVSDAGTPAISDPGAKVVAAAHAAGFAVIPIPGPSAVTTLLSAAGLEGEGFRFVGFLPSAPGARRRRLGDLAIDPAILVFFEAPHRIDDCLAALVEAFGAERPMAIGRELSKRFEEIARMPLGQAREWLESNGQRSRGEFTLAVAGAPGRRSLAQVRDDTPMDAVFEAMVDRLLRTLAAEFPSATAARLAAKVLARPRAELYRRLLELTRR